MPLPALMPSPEVGDNVQPAWSDGNLLLGPQVCHQQMHGRREDFVHSQRDSLSLSDAEYFPDSRIRDHRGPPQQSIVSSARIEIVPEPVEVHEVMCEMGLADGRQARELLNIEEGRDRHRLHEHRVDAKDTRLRLHEHRADAKEGAQPNATEVWATELRLSVHGEFAGPLAQGVLDLQSVGMWNVCPCNRSSDQRR